MKFFVITGLVLFPILSFASAGKPPAALTQDISCFAFAQPVVNADAPVDVTTLEPALTLTLQMHQKLGRVVVRNPQSQSAFNGIFSTAPAVLTTALIPNLSRNRYDKRQIQSVLITLATEPAPFPAIKVEVPVLPDILRANRKSVKNPYLTTLYYTNDPIDGAETALHAVCYYTQPGV